MATKPRQRTFWMQVGEYTSLAFMLPAATVIGYGIGYMLDRALGTGFLKAIFLVLGIASGFVQLIRQVMKDTRGRENG
ncbi:MAG TPA: AtpZ/AtpI family protein [Bryobacteraceae bacterium]|nr:AtpZ/AtpI family protein [Bryobacteraceae bacterium]